MARIVVAGRDGSLPDVDSMHAAIAKRRTSKHTDEALLRGARWSLRRHIKPSQREWAIPGLQWRILTLLAFLSSEAAQALALTEASSWWGCDVRESSIFVSTAVQASSSVPVLRRPRDKRSTPMRCAGPRGTRAPMQMTSRGSRHLMSDSFSRLSIRCSKGHLTLIVFNLAYVRRRPDQLERARYTCRVCGARVHLMPDERSHILRLALRAPSSPP